MAETSRNDVPAATPPILPGQPAAPPELPETSAVSVPGRNSNAQLNRSAEAVGRGVGNAVAGVRNIPQQFERLRSRIHLVNRYPDPEGESLSEVAGDWRDAVEASLSEMSEAANHYGVELLDETRELLVELRHLGERSYFRLRRDLNHRREKARRLSREQPLRFIAACAVAAFALGVAMRIGRSSHE